LYPEQKFLYAFDSVFYTINRMKKQLLFFLFFIAAVTRVFAQCGGTVLTVLNPSFEGSPAPHVTPPNWDICLPGVTPDTQPGSWGISLPAQCGSTYIGLVQQGSWIEGASQTLSSPMVAGTTYNFTIALASTNSTGGGISPGCVELQIWGNMGGNSGCDQTELLWSSGDVYNAAHINNWVTHNVSFTPSQNWGHMLFLVHDLGCAPQPYIMLDCLSPIVPVSDIATFTSSTVCQGSSTQFTDQSTSASGTITNWSWDFGDGSPVVHTQNPSHIFPNAGTFNVNLTIISNIPCTTSVSVPVVVNPMPVVSASASPADICAGQSANLISSGAASYTWMPGNLSGSSVSVSPATTTTYYVTGTNTSTGCSAAGSVTVTVNPNPVLTVSATPTDICSGQTSALHAGGATTYSWQPGSLSGDNVTVSPTTNTTYTVTGTIGNCTSTTTVSVNVKPTPAAVVPSDITVCNTGTVAAATFTSNPPGSTFQWSNSNPAIGLSNSGTGNIPSFTATNTGSAPISSTITVLPTLNGCDGPTANYNITVNPSPAVVLPANITVCNTGTVAATNFSSIPAGGTYTWTNSNTVIGLAASGSGNVPSFTASNTGNTPISATVSVTPTVNTCVGTASSYTITVDPTPTAILPSDITVCNNGTVTPGGFTSTPAGGTFTWTNTDNTIGLSFSGSGNIAPFTAVNTGTAPVTATVSVIPTVNGCIGTPSTFTITVNPTPGVNVPADIVVCPATLVPGTTLTSPTAGATYAWANSNITIGLGSGGIGDVPSFTSSNTGITAITATITVTPSANNCIGTPSSYMITVNALPVLTFDTLPSLCPSSPAFALTQGAPAGGTYSGPGVTNNTFDPNAAGVGLHTITYAYTDPITTCSNTIDQVINIYAGITIGVNPSSAYICPGDHITLTANGADGYLWLPPLGLNVTSGSVVIASPPSSIVYTVIGTNNNGCSGSVTSSINYYNTNMVSISAVPPWGCNPVEITMNFSPQNLISDSTWHWNFGDYYSNDNVSTEKFPTHLYQHEGNYIVSFTAEDINGCKVTDYQPVEVYITPTADFYYNPLVAYTDNPTIYFYDLSMGANFWLWNFDDPDAESDNYADEQNPIHVFTDSGTYVVQLIVTSSHNCSDTIEKPVTILPQTIIFIPNAFTPDHDGYNEIFKPVISGIDEKSYKFYIFDRWGKEQFFTDDVDTGWDGYVNDKESESGVYVYLVKYSNYTGKEFKLKGIVTLVR